MKKLALILLAGVWLFGVAAGAFGQSVSLLPGDYLFPPQKVLAPGCYYELVMQYDGNLVTYNNASSGNSSPLWATGTQNQGGYATMQHDGNFVVYNWSDQPVFATGTQGTPDTYLAQQDDGNVVVYQDDSFTFFRPFPVWASGATTAPTTQPCQGSGEKTVVLTNVNLQGADYKHFSLPSEATGSWCGYYCAQEGRCQAFTYVPPSQGQPAVCWLKSSIPAAQPWAGLFSGYKARQ